jgi:hypothetical protein
LGSLLCPNDAKKPGYGQLNIYSSAEAAADQLENQSVQDCVVKVMQLLDEMLKQVTQKPFRPRVRPK